ncbi:uncharacterized protein LOC134832245 [Culicoides brevitarsis]|uniref:uncharacterized protein LOC134832245 n=1 Tax=Culicoides brevitarsis TaxID=469753 RepID=UPI00307B61D7
MVRKKKGFGRATKDTESGRERTKRLKHQKEVRQRFYENETPEHREERLRKAKERRQRRLAELAKETADKFVEDISRIVPKQKKKKPNEDFGDHPAISFDKFLGVKAEKIDKKLITKEIFSEPEENLDEIVESESEEDEDSPSESYKLNIFKVRLFDLQRKIDLAEDLLNHERLKSKKLCQEMTDLRKKALKLEEMYGIPIL